MGLQILMKEVRNYIAGHKYRRGDWNLPHKFHLYLNRWRAIIMCVSPYLKDKPSIPALVCAWLCIGLERCTCAKPGLGQVAGWSNLSICASMCAHTCMCVCVGQVLRPVDSWSMNRPWTCPLSFKYVHVLNEGNNGNMLNWFPWIIEAGPNSPNRMNGWLVHHSKRRETSFHIFSCFCDACTPLSNGNV